MRYEIMKADVPNSNGRIYPLSIVEEIANKINGGHILVCLDNPKYGIEVERVVGRVAEAKIEDGVLSAEVVVIPDNPMGAIYTALLEARVRLSLTVAGTADLSDDGAISNYSLGYAFLHSGHNA